MVALLLAISLLGGCRKKPAQGHQPRKARPAAGEQTPGTGLARLLTRIPADATWAVAIQDLPGLRHVLRAAWKVFRVLPGFHARLEAWKTRVERALGFWPLGPDALRQLGVEPEGELIVYRRGARDQAATVVIFRAPRLWQTLTAITAGIKRHGARAVEAVGTTTIRQGKRSLRLYTVGRGWTCGPRRDLAVCASVPPGRWRRATRVERPRSAWHRLLKNAPKNYLQGQAALLLGPGGPRPVGWIWRQAGRFGVKPRGLLLSLTLRRRLLLNGLLLFGAGDTPAADLSLASRPGRSGLAAVTRADAALRLRVPPARLLSLLKHWVPGFSGALSDLERSGLDPANLVRKVLTGEILLASTATGLVVAIGVQDAGRATRLLEGLDLALGPRILAWQERLRGLGRGWDLRRRHYQVGETRAHALALQVPRGAGSPFRLLREGSLGLHWGVTQGHLLLCTDEKLFRRALALVDQSDGPFLGQLPGATARAAFTRANAVALFVRPDDPLSALPAPQSRALGRAVARLAPPDREWVRLARSLADLADSLTASVTLHRVGLGFRVTVAFIRSPGTKPHTPQPLIETLIKKYGHNEAGYWQALRALAQDPGQAPGAAKAARYVAGREGVLQGGLWGLGAALLLPLLEQRARDLAKREAEAGLRRLAEALQRLAGAAQKRPGRARRRWHRMLQSTPLTPVRSCCDKSGPACQSRPGDWRHPTWGRLGFRLSGTHRYRYQITFTENSVARRFQLRAVGDLDCNGRHAVYQLSGRIDRQSGRLTLGRPAQLHPDR